jgi:CheY-like chemotaxis protein
MLSVLLVDDEPSVLEVTRRYLEQDGEMTVTTASSAEEALNLLIGERFDAIVADYQLNAVTGIDLLKAVRGVPEGTGSIGYDPAFIILTGKSREKVAIDALNYGADYYLRKGRKSGEMLSTLKVAISYGVRKRHALRGSPARPSSSGEEIPAAASASGEGGMPPVTSPPGGMEHLSSVVSAASGNGTEASPASHTVSGPDAALIGRLTKRRDGSVIVSSSGSILFIHPVAAPLLGLDSPEAGIGRQIGDLIPDASYDLVLLKRLSMGIISNYRLPQSTSRKEATITLSRITFRNEEAALIEFRPDQR